MFPHYAQATTESALKHTYKQLKAMKWQPKIIEMGHFETDEEYVVPLANSIESQQTKTHTCCFLITACRSRTSNELTPQRITVSRLTNVAR